MESGKYSSVGLSYSDFVLGSNGSLPILLWCGWSFHWEERIFSLSVVQGRLQLEAEEGGCRGNSFYSRVLDGGTRFQVRYSIKKPWNLLFLGPLMSESFNTILNISLLNSNSFPNSHTSPLCSSSFPISRLLLSSAFLGSQSFGSSLDSLPLGITLDLII